MNREQILKKSREEACDEGREYMELLGIRRGFYYSSAIYACISVLNLFSAFRYGKQMEAFYASSSIYFCFLASISSQKYKFSQEKHDKLQWIASTVASMVFLLCFILEAVWA